MEKENKIKREPTLLESIIVLLALVFFVSVGFGICKFELQAMLLCTAVFTVFMAMRIGLIWDDCEKAISQRVVKVMPIVYIMFTVGGLIATLIFSGTIPMMIYYGLQIIKPHLLLPCSFLVCCVLSVVTGTGWGSAGTAGIALIGIAIGMDVPLAPVAACIVAGATFGDNLSPMSDTTLLAALSAGTGLYDHIRSMLYTTVPAVIHRQASGRVNRTAVQRRIEGNHRILHQDLQPHAHQHQPSGQLRFALEADPEGGPHLHPGGGDDEGAHPDEGDGREDIHPEDGEGDPHRQGVDGGGHRQHQHGQGGQGGVAVLLLPAQGLPDHVPADEGEQDKGDPVVHTGDHVGEGGPQQPADQGHQSLKGPEPQSHNDGVPGHQGPDGQPLADGHGKGVHGQAYGQGKQRGKSHNTSSLPVCLKVCGRIKKETTRTRCG